jgi:hypothetical protein
MKKIILGNDIVACVDFENNKIEKMSCNVVSRGYLIKEQCEVVIDDKHFQANAGDILVALYSPVPSYKVEYHLMPASYFDNFLERTIAYEEKKANENCCDVCKSDIC